MQPDKTPRSKLSDAVRNYFLDRDMGGGQTIGSNVSFLTSSAIVIP